MNQRQRLSLVFLLKQSGPFYTLLRAIARLPRFVCNAFVDILRRIIPKNCNIGPATSSFSAFQLVREKKLTGRILFDRQPNGPEKQKSIIKISALNQNGEQPWPFFWSLHKNARLLSRTLALVNEDKQLCIESTFGESRRKTDPGWTYCPLGKPVKLDGPWTSLVSRWLPADEPVNYFHWLFDALPRLAFTGEFPVGTRIIIPPNPQPFQVETLKALGLESRFRTTEESHLLIDQYYFASPPSMTGCYNPFAIQFLREKFLKCADAGYDSPKHIYIQRSGTFRGVANEAEVFDFFTKAGFAIVDTAKLTFAQQIQLFSRAEIVCGPHGAAFANAVWCKPGCKVVEFFAEDYLNGCFEWITEAVGAHHDFLICPSDPLLNIQVDTRGLDGLIHPSG